MAQKKEFLSGAVPVKQQLQVKAFCEQMAVKTTTENKENKDDRASLGSTAPKKEKESVQAESSNAAAAEMAAMD